MMQNWQIKFKTEISLKVYCFLRTEDKALYKFVCFSHQPGDKKKHFLKKVLFWKNAWIFLQFNSCADLSWNNIKSEQKDHILS